MAVLIVIPRALSSGAASISSYFFGAELPREASAIVKAAVSVVFPWSTWPIVPILTWGFFLSNLPRAARTVNRRWREEEEEGAVVAGEWRKRVDGFGVKEDERISLEDFEGRTVPLVLIFVEAAAAAVAEAAEIEAMEEAFAED